MPSKTCRACGVSKPLSDFHKARRNKDGRFTTCKPCRAGQAAEYYQDNPEAFAERRKREDPEHRRDLRLRRTYGITAEQYDEMLQAQGGVCAVCLRPPKKMPLNVDHDHKTGAVRGLLCWSCNHRLVGSSGDDPERLRRAASYLEEPPAEPVIGRVIAPAKPKRRRKSKKRR